jgi:hypothetical protein
MNLRELFARKDVRITAVILTVALAVLTYFALRRPPRVEMDRYVPASALAFVEVTNLADLLDGLTSTKAWRELAPALGLSSQLQQIGKAFDLMSRTGIGPDETVVAGRAQFAIAVTSIEAETGASDDGPYVRFKPRFALIIETHSSPSVAERLVRERASILAARIYGQTVAEQQEDHHGTPISVFQGPEPDRQMIAAASGSLVLISNHGSAIRSCLDTINGREAALSEDSTLKQLGRQVGRDGSVFAFVTEKGIERLVEFGPALLASRLTTDPDRISAVSSLFGHLSKQTTAGLFYSSEFVEGGVTEKYLTVLRPQVAEALAAAFKPAPGAILDTLEMVPRQAQDFTVLNVAEVGELPERLLKQLSVQLDVVAGLALREFVIDFRKQLGLEPADSLAGAVGNSVALVKFNQSEPTALIVRVLDTGRVSQAVSRYLTKGNAKVTTENYNGVEISVSSNEDGRSAAFARDYLILGTREQIARLIDTGAEGKGVSKDERLKQILISRPNGSAVISYKPGVEDAAEMMLAVARISRVSDGSRELLEQADVRAAIERLPPSVSFTEFRGYGIYTETRSAVGSFSFITSLIGDEGGVKE